MPNLPWSLQTVVIKRQFIDDPKNAMRMAATYTDKGWRRIKVNKTSYRFEVLPDNIFNNWKSNKLNDTVTLVYGARVEDENL